MFFLCKPGKTERYSYSLILHFTMGLKCTGCALWPVTFSEIDPAYYFKHLSDWSNFLHNQKMVYFSNHHRYFILDRNREQQKKNLFFIASFPWLTPMKAERSTERGDEFDCYLSKRKIINQKSSTKDKKETKLWTKFVCIFERSLP